jgi:membrane protease YdiL (CAAX protease family)
MKYNWFEMSSPSSRVFLMLGFMVVCVVFGFVLSIVFAIPFTNKSAMEIINLASNIQSMENINLLKYMQIVQSIAFFIIPALLMPVFWGRKTVNYLHLNRKPQIILILIAAGLILAAIPFVNFTELINSKLKLPQFMSGIEQWMKNSEATATTLSENFLKVTTLSGLLVNLFMMAVLPALGEEFVFRGVFQRLFTEWSRNYHIGILASAVLFSAFHMQFYGFIPRMLLGMSFGYMFVWSGSLWVPIIAHFVNNAFGVIYYYLYNNGLASNSLQTTGTSENGNIYALASLCLSLFLMFAFLKYSKNKNLSASKLYK